MKKLLGRVISDKMKKTIVVKVDSFWQHPVYKKRIKKTKHYLVHDEKGVEVGQKVIIGERKPVSKRKCWQVLEVVKK